MMNAEWVQKRLADAIPSVLVFAALLGLTEFLINPAAAAAVFLQILLIVALFGGVVLAVWWLFGSVTGQPSSLRRPSAIGVLHGVCGLLGNLMIISRSEIYFATFAVVAVLYIAQYLVRRIPPVTAGPSAA